MVFFFCLLSFGPTVFQQNLKIYYLINSTTICFGTYEPPPLFHLFLFYCIYFWQLDYFSYMQHKSNLQKNLCEDT